MKHLVLLSCALFFGCLLYAQQSTPFQTYQNSIRVRGAVKNKEDILKQEFAKKNIPWPAKYIYIRSFKYDGELEIWVKQNRNDTFQLFKTYRVCLQSGTMGPKRMEGDFQVPEGFYYITRFNPNSAYHLSLGLNYPNASDRILSDPIRPGSGIYIHGSCVSVGCIPVTDSDVEEIYILAANAHNAGQEYIPVNVFPIRYKKKSSEEYLKLFLDDHPEIKSFATQLQDAYNYFEKHHQQPVILIDGKGEYLVGN